VCEASVQRVRNNLNHSINLHAFHSLILFFANTSLPSIGKVTKAKRLLESSQQSQQQHKSARFSLSYLIFANTSVSSIGKVTKATNRIFCFCSKVTMVSTPENSPPLLQPIIQRLRHQPTRTNCSPSTNFVEHQIDFATLAIFVTQDRRIIGTYRNSFCRPFHFILSKFTFMLSHDVAHWGSCMLQCRGALWTTSEKVVPHD
jgi:hypothetical protein